MGILRRIENGTTTVKDANEVRAKGAGILLIGIGVGFLLLAIILAFGG